MLMRHQLALAVAMATFSTATLAGCGGDSDGAGATTPSADAAIQVMTYATQDYNAMIKIGISEGIFEDAGVSVTQVDQPTGLQAFQALRATNSNVTISTMPTFAAALESGENSLQMFCGAQPHIFVSIISPNDSDLPTVGDSVSGIDVLKALEGKTIGTLTPPGSGFQKLFETAIAEAGVQDITYVNIGADARTAGAALQRGQLDATLAAPTMTQALVATGEYKELMLMSEQSEIPTYSQLYGGPWVAPRAELEQSPEKFEAFCEGLEGVADYISNLAPEDASAALQEAIGVDAAVAAQLVADQIYQRYDTSLPIDSILSTFDSYVDVGLLKAPIGDPESYIHQFN